LLILLYELDHRLIASIFVRVCPEHHLREERSKIDSFCCQQADQLSLNRSISVGGGDSTSYEFPQTIGQNVRRDSFQEFLAGSESSEHHVADNRQRPGIARYLHGSVQQTSRPPLGTAFFLHVSIFSLAFNK